MSHGDRYGDRGADDHYRRAEPAAGSLKPLIMLFTALFGLVVIAFGFWMTYRLFGRIEAPPAVNPDAKPKEVVANGPLDAEEVEANTVYEAVKGSVVNVDTVVRQRGMFDDRQGGTQTGTGSGFIWDADGRIVTNFHVVEEAVRRPQQMAIRVVMSDRTAVDAQVVGVAADYDLAVVQLKKVDRDKLHPITLADSGDLKVGQKVFAIGNPFGLSLTLTTGIISNLDRTIESPTGAPIPKAIQHTAQINPGNSGGPLLNRGGKLIGVNTSIATPSGGNVGIGFSIPSTTVNEVVTEIIKGEVARGDLGVRLYDQKQMRRAGYDRGVMIAEVVPGGAADRAKLRGLRRNAVGRAEPGDIIVAINGQPVADQDAFQAIVSRLRPGAKVTIRYVRNDEEWETAVTL